MSDNVVRYSVQYKLFIVLYCIVYYLAYAANIFKLLNLKYGEKMLNARRMC